LERKRNKLEWKYWSNGSIVERRHDVALL